MTTLTIVATVTIRVSPKIHLVNFSTAAATRVCLRDLNLFQIVVGTDYCLSNRHIIGSTDLVVGKPF